MFGRHASEEGSIICSCFEEDVLEIVPWVVTYEEAVEEEVNEDEDCEEDHEVGEWGEVVNQPSQCSLSALHIRAVCVGFILIHTVGGTRTSPQWAVGVLLSWNEGMIR